MNKELKNQPKTAANVAINTTALQALANILQVRTGLKSGKGKFIAPCV